MGQRLAISIIIAVNIVIGAWAFAPFLSAPQDYLFENKYDGLKNHYTYLYHQQSADRSLLHFTGMNYPYGELVLYTDNSPLLSVPIKFLGTHISAIKNNAQPIYILLVLCNLIVAVVLGYKLIYKLTGHILVSAACSTIMVWLSPQFERISAGHYSLVFISLTLLIICLTVKVWEKRDDKKGFLLFSFLLALTGFASFFLHGYYIFLFGFWIGYILLLGAWFNKNYKLAIAGVTIPVLIIALSFVTLKLIDPDLKNRGDAVIGYGFQPWESRLECLVTAPEKLHIKFFIPTGYYPNYENAGYLGNAVLYGIPLVLLALVITKNKAAEYSPDKKLVLGLFITALLLLFISFGESYHAGNGKFIFTNIFNPVLYLRAIFPQFTHIRCPARFQWFFHIVMYVVLAVLIKQLLATSKYRYFAILVSSVVFIIGIIDVHDSLKPYSQISWTHDNVLASPLPQPEIRNEKYDAILTIPFYHAGSTDLNYTLETDEGFMTNAMQLSVQNGLPLMACKMSRTPEYQARALINIFLKDTLSTDLKQRLQGKKILVVQSNLVYADTANTYKSKFEPAYTAFATGPQVVTKFNMDTLGTFGNFTYFRWEP